MPVTPSRTWWLRPFSRPSASDSIAAGWSPVGSNGATSLKSGIVSSLPQSRTNRTGVLLIRPGRLGSGTRPNGGVEAARPARARLAVEPGRVDDPGRGRRHARSIMSRLGRRSAGRRPRRVVPRPTSRPSWTSGSQVDQPDLVALGGQAALDELDRLDDDRRGAAPRRPRPSRPGSAAARRDGRSPRGRAAPPGPRRPRRPSAARSSAPSARRSSRAEPGDDGLERRLAWLEDLARDPIGVDDDDARPLAKPARHGRLAAADRSGQADPDGPMSRAGTSSVTAPAPRARARHPRPPPARLDVGQLARHPPHLDEVRRPRPDPPSRARGGSCAGPAGSAPPRRRPSAADRHPSTASPSSPEPVG